MDIYGHLIVGGNRVAANKLDDYESITAGQAPLETLISMGYGEKIGSISEHKERREKQHVTICFGSFVPDRG